MVGDEIKKLDGPIFITGHTGFKGSWLSILLNHLRIEHFGYSLEAEAESLYKRAGLESISNGVVGDVKDLENLSKVIKGIRPSVVVHLAAQPLVLKSYQEPLETFQTNCIGTANVLKVSFDVPSIKHVLVITTDKVYRNNNSGKKFVESDSLEGKDPYSASKVAAESVCAAWQQISKISGGPRVLVARAGNVIGGGDFARDRLVPDAIRAIISEQNLFVRNPQATRPWQHVLDPLIGYLKYIEQTQLSLTEEPSLNFGPVEPSLRVVDVLEIAKQHFKDKLKITLKAGNHDVESQTLDLDPSRAIAQLGWRPKWSQIEALDRTFIWWNKTLTNPTHALENCVEDIRNVLEKEH